MPAPSPLHLLPGKVKAKVVLEQRRVRRIVTLEITTIEHDPNLRIRLNGLIIGKWLMINSGLNLTLIEPRSRELPSVLSLSCLVFSPSALYFLCKPSSRAYLLNMLQTEKKSSPIKLIHDKVFF